MAEPLGEAEARAFIPAEKREPLQWPPAATGRPCACCSDRPGFSAHDLHVVALTCRPSQRTTWTSSPICRKLYTSCAYAEETCTHPWDMTYTDASWNASPPSKNTDHGIGALL